MGHELIIYGIIEGATGSTDEYRALQQCNVDAINQLPQEDEWPWLTRQMFQLPPAYPQGTYQTQVIHFGLSMKDGIPLNSDSSYDPIKNWRNPKRDSITGWIEKFECLLRQMFWYGANVHVQSDFEPARLFSYNIAANTIETMFDPTDPTPVSAWDLIVTAT